MFDANRLGVLDRGKIEFLIPVQQFPLIGNQRHHLPPGQVNVKEFLRRLDEFFHV